MSRPPRPPLIPALSPCGGEGVLIAIALGSAVVLVSSTGVAAQTSMEVRQRVLAAYQAGTLADAETIAGSWLAEHPADAEMHFLVGMMRVTEAEERRRAGAPADEYTPLYGGALEPLLEAERLAGGRHPPELDKALGNALLLGGRFADAEARFTRAIAAEPQAAALYTMRGKCRIEIGRYADAETDLSRAIELRPDDFQARVLLAHTLFVQGRETEARDSLLGYYAVLEKQRPDPRHFTALYEISRYSLLMHRFDEAADALERAVGLRPDHVGARLGLAGARFRLGELDAARDGFERVESSEAATTHERAEALHHLAMIAQHHGDQETARRRFEAALQLEPKRADSLRGYAATLRRLGETAREREILKGVRDLVDAERSVSRLTDQLLIAPLDHTARVKLIRLLGELERWDEAGEQLEALKRNRPSHPAIPELDRLVSRAS